MSVTRAAFAALLVTGACTADDVGLGHDAIVVYPDAPGPPLPDAPPYDPCLVPLSCGSPYPGEFSVCGRFHDVETDATIAAPLTVEFREAIDLDAPPLPVTDLLVDECGRLRARGVTRPASGTVALIVSGDADRAPTATVLLVANAQARNNEKLYSLRRATETRWMETAGLTGETFVERGAALVTYVDEESERVAGVPIGAGWVFADAAPTSRSTIDPTADATGPNGAALLDPASTETLMESRERCWYGGPRVHAPGMLVLFTRGRELCHR